METRIDAQTFLNALSFALDINREMPGRCSMFVNSDGIVFVGSPEQPSPLCDDTPVAEQLHLVV